jgi:hypothetical protein
MNTQQIRWTARCKSGYVFNGKTCRRFTSRGALLCTDCIDAVVIPAEAKPSFLATLKAFFVQPVWNKPVTF